MQYSKELLAEIHIRLDREGLDGLTEKEISVLLSEQLDQSTERIVSRIDQSTEQICNKLDEVVLPIYDKLDETVLPIHDKLDRAVLSINNKIDEAVSPVHQELTRFRAKVDLWAKVISSGIWAVVASLIASLIFKACGAG